MVSSNETKKNNQSNNNGTTAAAAAAAVTCHLARVMEPGDANWAGNVHGGTIMQFIANAAMVTATRYFNQHDVRALMARMETMTFRQPIHVGDVANVHATVVFASHKTVAVSVTVTAERLNWDGHREDPATNEALVWTVGRHLSRQNADGSYELANAPEFRRPSRNNPKALQMYEQAKQLYQIRINKKEQRRKKQDLQLSTTENDTRIQIPSHPAVGNEVDPNQTAVELAQVMMPSDCLTNTGLVKGGVVMKLMDNACAIVAVRHCATNVVTISVDCLNLVEAVMVGDVLRIKARASFASHKSLEIQVCVVLERFVEGAGEGCWVKKQAVEPAYFTFVSLDGNHKTLPIRPLLIQTLQDQKLFHEGQKRYEQRKKEPRFYTTVPISKL